MSQGSITSRYGKLEFAQVFTYRFANKLLNNKEVKQNFTFWLTNSKSLQFFRLVFDGFETLSPMDDHNWQYKFTGTQTAVPPLTDIPVFSHYLRNIFNVQLEKIYKKSGQDFIYDQFKLMDFQLDFCFNFYVEIFDDGRFLLHFYGSSHITLAHDNIQAIINIVKSCDDADTNYYPKFFITDNISGRSKVIHPLSKKSVEEMNGFLIKFPDYKYTFDYQFMGKYFPKSLSTFMAKSKIKYPTIHTILNKASSHLAAVDGLKLFETALLPVKLNKVKPEMNLMIGNDKIVSKLSATYYSGLYRPLTKATILPVLCGQDMTVLPKVKQLTDLHFNSNGSVQWLPPIVAQGPTIDFVELERIKKEHLSVFIMIITEGTLSHATIGTLREKKLKYQIMQLPADHFRLSNFVVKCLYKMGAKIALMKDSGLKKDGYIIGLDMGHYHGSKSESGFSTLVTVFFTAAGEHIYTSKNERLPLNEALQPQSLSEAFTKFKNYLIQSKRNMPKHFVLHRDGRLHVNDHVCITETVQNLFSDIKIDIVEIIKSGHPYIFTNVNHQIKNAASGQFWEVKDKDYALLITNDQETVPGEVLKPIVIKRKYGDLPFETIVSQVYWYCKLYTNNIYYPSRLPATTELANNRAGTGNKKYKPSFKKE